MNEHLAAESPALRAGLSRLYRDFFDRAERKRRWSIADDVPWERVNKSMDPAVADVVESFCAVEMYLPDYIGKALPMVRANRGWAAFHANWGYEESKHSLALGDWLLRSGSRSEEQMADLEARVFSKEYQLPQDTPLGMVIYAMIQELATFVHYRNLRDRVEERGDPALARLLSLAAVDERAHHSFYRNVVQLFLELDREATLDKLRTVLLSFSMPAVHLLDDGPKRVAAVAALGVFDNDVFLREVFIPVLAALGVKNHELRRNTRKAPAAAGVAGK
jgi:acyl-[acyl-carrier-protein] desaturase